MPSIRRQVALTLFVVSCAWAQNAHVQNVLSMDEFVQDWKISKQFTLDVANAMPAEYYDFTPSAGEMTFAEQMLHIAEANVYRFLQITGSKTPFELTDPKKLPKDKASVMRMLAQSFDYVIGVLPQITEEQLKRTFHTDWKGRPDPDGRAMIVNMFVHVAHHRAQCEVYLRLKGITPPTYVF